MWARAEAACLALAMNACAVGPDFVRPDAPKVDGYVRGSAEGTATANGQAQRFNPGGRLDPDWWRLLGSEPLDTLIAEVLTRNPTLEAAQATLRQSQDSLRAGYGVFWPSIGYDATAARERFNPASFGQAVPAQSFNLFTLSASVSYVLDVWGGDRRQVEALAAQRDQQRFNALATYLMLASNAANTAIARSAYLEQIAATEDLVARQKEQVDIAQTQARAGIAPYANVLSLVSQRDATLATIPPLRQKIDQSEHLLAALSGHTPGDWSAPDIPLAGLKLPVDVPLSLPSQLVRQRPDVLAAEAQLHQSNALVGVATAALLPRLSLTPSLGLTAGSLSNQSTSNDFVWNLGAGIAGPLFQGGTLWYQRRAAIDAKAAAIANYRQTVLSAFQQVADSLRGLQHDAEDLAAQTEAVESAKQALDLVQANYDAGLANYLQVLTADEQWLQARLGYIQAVAQRLQDTVALYVALGGGWWNAPKPPA
jgi:NodT family efflux transporter outer membrane factor (OMF) lipoprotein